MMPSLLTSFNAADTKTTLKVRENKDTHWVYIYNSMILIVI